MAKLPSFQFYPGDWMKDPGVRRCSHFAKGLLIDLLCLMFEQNPRGCLANANGSPWSIEDIAQSVGGDIEELTAGLTELEAKGVLHRNDDNCLYSKRLIRDEEVRQARSKAGSKGGSKKQANLKQVPQQIPEEEDEAEEEDEEPLKSPPKRDTKGDKSTPESRVLRKVITKSQCISLYKLYPRLIGKEDAIKAIQRSFAALCTGDRFKDGPEALAWLTARLVLFRKLTIGAEKKFIPHPATWFKQGRYDDDQAEWKNIGRDGQGDNGRARPNIPKQRVGRDAAPYTGPKARRL